MRKYFVPALFVALVLGACLSPLLLLPSGAQDSSSTARYISRAAADPSSAREGQVYANTTSHVPKFYNGTSWVTLASDATGTTLTSPKVVNGLFDANGNSMIAFSPTTSAVDGLTIANAATANPANVTLSATGSDTNIGLYFKNKGAASFTFQFNTTTSDVISINSSGTLSGVTNTGGTKFQIVPAGGANAALYRAASDMQYGFNSATSLGSGSIDSGFGRVAAAEVAATDGSTGRGAFYFKRPLTAKTTTYTVTVAETGKTFTNEGAGGGFTFTLPTPAAGLHYSFCVVAAQALTIVPATPASEGIYVTTLDANDSIASSTAGHCINLEAVNATTWMAKSFTGSWP